MIDWYNLCGNSNPEVLEILKNNYDKINWYNLSRNPNIFQINYDHNSNKKRKICEFN